MRALGGLLIVALAGTGAVGQEEETAAPVDLATKLGTMFVAGQYQQAWAESEGLEKTLKPRAKDPQFIPRTKLWVDVLVFRALLERRMGDPESAAENYETGFKALGDKDLRKSLSAVLRGGDKAVPPSAWLVRAWVRGSLASLVSLPANRFFFAIFPEIQGRVVNNPGTRNTWARNRKSLSARSGPGSRPHFS